MMLIEEQHISAMKHLAEDADPEGIPTAVLDELVKEGLAVAYDDPSLEPGGYGLTAAGNQALTYAELLS
jgi:hypothetical protein